MRLVKENINMNSIVGNAAMQIYINEEVTVSEANKSVSYIIKDKGRAVVDSVKVRDEQINLAGTLEYALLYITEEGEMVQGLQGEISFDEVIRMPGLREEDEAFVRINVDNISIKVLNPRKLLVKAELTAYATAEEMTGENVAVDITEGEDISVLKKKIEALSMVVDKTETFRVKEDIAIPSGKPAIYKMVWKDVKIKNVATRLMDKIMHVNGEMNVFIMYIPDEDGAPQQWHESVISFGGTIDMPEVNEDLIAHVNVDMQNASLELNANELGERRELSANVLLRLDVKVYEEREMEILEDVYSPFANLIPVIKEGCYHKLLVKNTSKCKNTVKLQIDNSRGNILQICTSGADVRIDSVSVCENGLMVTGKIKAYIIYVSTSDREPVCSVCQEVDFSHKIDAEGITKADEYYINWKMEQVTANMVSSDEVEMKAVVLLDTIVFKNCREDMIVDLDENEIDMDKILKMPTIKGHVVQKGETLWKLAKENYTTVDKIMADNNLKSDQIKVGDRLLITKCARK